MKKIFVFIAFVMLSATYSFAQTYPKKIKKAMLEARDETRNIFIELNNGTVLTFEKLKIKAGFMQYERFEGDGKKLDISFDSVRCYQTEDYYAYRKHTSPKFKIGKMPSSELFAKRIKQGKIELFFSYQQYNEDTQTLDREKSEYTYIRKGENGILEYNILQVLPQMLADNTVVSAEYDEMKRTNRWNIGQLIDKYNSTK